MFITNQPLLFYSIDEKLHPFLQQIDQVEEGVAELERAAYSLDQYSKRLGMKFFI